MTTTEPTRLCVALIATLTVAAAAATAVAGTTLAWESAAHSNASCFNTWQHGATAGQQQAPHWANKIAAALIIIVALVAASKIFAVVKGAHTTAQECRYARLGCTTPDTTTASAKRCFFIAALPLNLVALVAAAAIYAAATHCGSSNAKTAALAAAATATTAAVAWIAAPPDADSKV